MAWNQPGGGKKDPWSGGGGGGGQQQPPDLDEVFRKLQRRLSGIFGGGGGRGGAGGSGSGAGPIIGLGIVVLVLWLIYDSVSIIQEGERGVVLRFGSYDRTLTAGLQLHLPRPIEEVSTVDVEAVRSWEDEAQMLTKDENIVYTRLAIQYNIKNAQHFLFQVVGPEETLRQATESALREVIGRHNMDFVLREGRAEVQLQTQELLQQILDGYEAGLLITSINLQDVRPPQEVKDAFDDAIKAREDEQTFINEAEAYANSQIPQARGNAARELEQAKGHKESVIARAQGQADRFSLLAQQYARAPEVTRRRLYLETIETVMQDTNKVLVDVEGGGNNVFYLPLDQLRQRHRNSAGSSSASGESNSASTGQSSSGGSDNDYSRRDANRRRGEGR